MPTQDEWHGWSFCCWNLESSCSLLRNQERDQVGGKESLLYVGCQQLKVRGREDICPKVDFSLLTLGAKSFYRQREQREWAPCRNSTVSSDGHLEILIISGLTSIILIVLSRVNHQFQGQVFPISLRPVLWTVTTYVLLTLSSPGS